MFLGGLFFEWIQTVLILAGYVSGNATFPKPLNKSEEKKYLDLYAKVMKVQKMYLLNTISDLLHTLQKSMLTKKILRTLYLSAQSVLSKE